MADVLFLLHSEGMLFILRDIQAIITMLENKNTLKIFKNFVLII